MADVANELNPSAALTAYNTSVGGSTAVAPDEAIVSYKVDNITHYALATLKLVPDGNTNANIAKARYTVKNELTLVDGKFMSADGYSYTAKAKNNLFSADTKDFTGLGLAAIKYETFSENSDEPIKATLAKALENGDLTKDAIAVKLTAYAIVGDQNATKGSADYLKLNTVKTPVAGVSVTSLTDLLSRTSLKDSVNIFNLNSEVYTTDFEMGAKIYQLGKVASDVDITGSKFTFTLPFSGEQNVIIFDQAVAESNNDGVADETTTTAAAASTTAASSPKTGDVAPIAALAVVMMGACGAMVVASKKRA
jgi:hypothetical protein